MELCGAHIVFTGRTWYHKLLEAGLNVNKAGSIDVYDLQRLYEFINGINPNW